MFLGVLAAFPQSAARAAEPISRDELRADLTQAYDLLKSHHPNLHAHTSREEFEALYRRLIDSTGEANSRLDAYGALTALVGAVCDEHTLTFMDNGVPGFHQGWPWFDYPLIVDRGKLYLEHPRSGTKDEVLSIGEVKGSDIAASLAARFPSDGCLGDGTLFVSEYLPVSGNIVAGMIGESGPYVVRTHPRGFKVPRLELVRVTDGFDLVLERRRAESRRFNKVRAALRELDFRQPDPDRKLRPAGLDYYYSDSRNLAYLQFDSFKTPSKSAQAIELVMRDIIEKNPDALIIDLVGNQGGSTNAAQMLMAFLLPRAHRLHGRAYVKNVSNDRPANFKYFDEGAEKLHRYNTRFFGKRRVKGGLRSAHVKKRSFGKPDYKGQLYVLVGPTSRSNSIKVATNLKRLRDATIVGSLTATDTVTYCPRAHGAFRLDHTGFTLQIPELCFRSPENRFNDEASLVPDVEVSALDVRQVDLNPRIIETAVEMHHGVATN